MTEHEIRAATLADRPAVDALLARSYPVLLKADYAPSVMVAAIPAMTKARPELLKSGTYYVVVAGAEIVAAGGWTAQSPGGAVVQGLGHIRHVVTDHRRIREGFGRALMKHTLASASASGITRMECWSTLTATAFYEAVGFVRHAEMTVPIGPAKLPFAAVQMFMDLPVS